MGSHLIRARAPNGGKSEVEIVRDRERVASYLEDAAHVPGGFAEAVVFPRSEREVADVLTSGSRVLPVGAQSSLTGGATPQGSVVLSTSRLQQVEMRRDCVRAGAGVTLISLHEQLHTRGAHYPPGPNPSRGDGRWHVSTNAAGACHLQIWNDAELGGCADGGVADRRRPRRAARRDAGARRRLFRYGTLVGRE